MPGKTVYCVNCREYVRFARPPVEVKTRIGARKRLVGVCDQCGSAISQFLPSECGPTAHSVRVGETVLRDLQRASFLLEVSQRAIVENILEEHLHAFVEGQLEKLERAGLIHHSERRRRQRELDRAIEGWVPPERLEDTAAGRPSGLGRLWRLLFGEER
ncbi:MAG: hypothetical protein ACYC3S_12900 [Chloroflexota bacterium]